MNELVELARRLDDLHRSGKEPYPVWEVIDAMIGVVIGLVEELNFTNERIGHLEGQLSNLEIAIHQQGIYTGRDE